MIRIADDSFPRTEMDVAKQSSYVLMIPVDPNLTSDKTSVTNFLQSVYIIHKPK